MEIEMGVDSLKIVPFALAAIQVYGQVYGQVYAEQMLSAKCRQRRFRASEVELSITYELVRSWHVTVLDSHNI